MMRVFALGCVMGVVVGTAASAAFAQMSAEPFTFGHFGDQFRSAILLDHNVSRTTLKPYDYGPGTPRQEVDRDRSDIGIVDPRPAREPSETFGWNVYPNSPVRDRYGYAYVADPAGAVTSWTAIASGLPVPQGLWIVRGRGTSPIDAWIMQAEALRRGTP